MNNEDLSGILDKLNIDKNSISPDMVNNFLSMLGNPKKDEEDNSENINENQNSTSSYSETASNSQNNANPFNSSSNSSSSNNSNNTGIDMEMLLKMKAMIDKMNVKDDPRSNLLMSLKPYLKESRKDKLDQYVQLMNMSKMIDFLPFMGGDKKKNEQ